MVILQMNYTLGDRMNGTLTCIKNHISDFNPLEDIGSKRCKFICELFISQNISKVRDGMPTHL